MKGCRRYIVIACTALSLVAAVPAGAGKCPPDSVKVGNVCIDTYEASVWQIPPSNIALVKLVQAGKATLAQLTGGGATLLSAAEYPSCSSPGYPANFPGIGNWTPVPGSNPPSPGVYAVSIPGVVPSACLTWFPGEPGLPVLREAAAHEPRVAGSGGQHAGPGHGQRDDGLQRGEHARPVQHRLAVEL